MTIEHTAITGNEIPAHGDSPRDALLAFYRAFNHRDLAAMAANWLQSTDAVMSNPIGGIKRGWEEIRAGYDKIFNGPAQVYVEFYDYSIQQQGDMFCAVGRERGHCTIDGATENKTLPLAIRTSRIYIREWDAVGLGCWRQIHHHGSIENPQLLDDYQRAIFSAGRVAP